MKPVIGFLVGVALLLSIGAGKPQPLSVILLSTNYQQPVEQQTPGGQGQPDQSLWVINPTTCAWDVDDQQTIYGAGYIEAGQSAGLTLCMVMDGAYHLVIARGCLTHGNGAFSVTLTYQTTWSARGPLSITGTTPDSAGCIVVCGIGPFMGSGNSIYFQPIPDSNGGVGQFTDYTASITNLSGHRRNYTLRTDMTLDTHNTEAPCPVTPPIQVNGECNGPIDVNEPWLCWASK